MARVASHLPEFAATPLRPLGLKPAPAPVVAKPAAAFGEKRSAGARMADEAAPEPARWAFNETILAREAMKALELGGRAAAASARAARKGGEAALAGGRSAVVNGRKVAAGAQSAAASAARSGAGLGANLGAGLGAGLARAFSAPRQRDDTLERYATAAKYSILTRRIGALAELAEAEAEALHEIEISEKRIHQAGAEIAAAGERAPSPMCIVSGWACRARVLATGKRQIIDFLLPGDAIGLDGGAEPVANLDVLALTTVETVSAQRLAQMAGRCESFPGVAMAVRRMGTQRQAFAANQIVRLGAQRPVERVAHMLAELRWRLAEAGLADDQQFPLPVTCETLGDALALTPGQVKQALRMLRTRGLAATRYGKAQALSPSGLRAAGEFMPPA
jgi:CRP-like cAMP-binding protein